MTALPELLSTAIASLGIGALIGVGGVGGVLLTPWLTQVAGMPVQQAAAIAMLSFIGPGLVALAAWWRSPGQSPWHAWKLLLGTIPGALAGTVALAYLPERAALLLVGTGVLAIGLHLLVARVRARNHPTVATQPGPHGLATGAWVGFGSALTVTSGPMILTPWLVWRGIALPQAIALGQLVQLPIAGTAALGHLWKGSLDVAAGLAIGLLLVAGVLAGRQAASRMPQQVLGRALGVLLVVAGGICLEKALR